MNNAADTLKPKTRKINCCDFSQANWKVNNLSSIYFDCKLFTLTLKSLIYVLVTTYVGIWVQWSAYFSDGPKSNPAEVKIKRKRGRGWTISAICTSKVKLNLSPFRKNFPLTHYPYNIQLKGPWYSHIFSCLRPIQTGCGKRTERLHWISDAKTQWIRNESIYCIKCSELRRSERAFNTNPPQIVHLKQWIIVLPRGQVQELKRRTKPTTVFFSRNLKTWMGQSGQYYKTYLT